MGVTIKDIARDTGLSLATISKYLNNKSISDENRLLIGESIKKLHYIPNRTAQALRSKTSHCICIFMPDTWDYHLGYECNYIIEYMKEHGYSALVRSYSGGSPDFSGDILFLENRQIDGVVLFTHGDYPGNLLSSLNLEGIPYVCLHQKPEIQADFIGCDDVTAGAGAAEYLSRMKRTRVILTGPPSYSSRLRIQSFLEEFKRLGILKEQVKVCLFPPCQDIPQSLISTLDKPELSDALVSLDHGTTMKLLECLSEKLMKTLPLLAFDDDDIFTAITPAITVFAQNTKQLGVEAASLLLKRMQGDKEGFPDARLIPPIFIERESVPPNPKDTP